MAKIIIIKGEDATIKDIQDHEGDLIHDLCNHFMSNDIPNPTHPRKQLSHFQEQKLAETIRGFLIANFDEDAAWEVYESFLHETQYMSVFDTVNEFGERFELDPLSYFGTNGWRYDLTTIIESAHKISEVDLIGDIANELINSFFPDHVENGSDIHDELTTLLGNVINVAKSNAEQATRWEDKSTPTGGSRIVCGESLLAEEIKAELEHIRSISVWGIEHILRFQGGK